MVNYILSLVIKKDNILEINLNINNLKNLDEFTTLFTDEYEMKEYLIKKGIISYKNYEKPLCIKYKSKGQMKKLRYGILYKEAKEFLDVAYIIDYLTSRKDDINLLEKLCNHYRNSYIQGTNLNLLKMYINKIRTNEELTTKDMSIFEETVKDFVTREVYNYDASTYRYKLDNEGNIKIKYRGLHDLAAFLSYDRKKKLKQNNIENEKNTTNYIATKQKIKRKNTNQISGQLNLFEIENGINY